MKLYSVQGRKLIEAEVVRESKLFYFLASSELTGWSSRLAKGAVNSAHGLVADSPRGAWIIEQNKARAEELTLRLAVEQNAGRRQTAQLALDALLWPGYSPEAQAYEIRTREARLASRGAFGAL